MYYFEQTVIMLRLISLENGIQYSKTKACKALSSLWMRQLTARGRISCLCFTSAAIRWITNLSLLPDNVAFFKNVSFAVFFDDSIKSISRQDSKSLLNPGPVAS